MRSVQQQRTRRRWVAAVAVPILALGGTIATGSPVAAAAAPGTVVSASVVALPADLAQYATIKRITYWTTDVRNSAITATGLVITPKLNRRNRTVAWAHGTTGIADKCTPSTNKDVFWPEARAAVVELLKRGWTVAAADYPGLGTPAPHPYLIGDANARAVIDSVKAARNLDSALSSQYVIDGHSQGGQTALFAAQIAPRYDGNLVLKGVSALAPVSTIDLLARGIAGTPGNGYLAMGLYGLATVEPGFDPASVLAAPARQRVGYLQSDCLYKILDVYGGLTAEQMLNGGALPESVIDRLVFFDDPAQAAPSAPVLVVHGTADEAVPYDFSKYYLVPALQAYNQPVTFWTIDGADHEGAVFDTTKRVADWIAARFS